MLEERTFDLNFRNKTEQRKSRNIFTLNFFQQMFYRFADTASFSFVSQQVESCEELTRSFDCSKSKIAVSNFSVRNSVENL